MSRMARRPMGPIGRWGLTALILLGCAPNPPPGTIVVVRRPPPDRVEVIGIAPGPGHIWVSGHWHWTGGDFDWIPGRWAPVERGFRRWVPGQWVHTRRGWFWREGHWRR